MASQCVLPACGTPSVKNRAWATAGRRRQRHSRSASGGWRLMRFRQRIRGTLGSDDCGQGLGVAFQAPWARHKGQVWATVSSRRRRPRQKTAPQPREAQEQHPAAAANQRPHPQGPAGGGRLPSPLAAGVVQGLGVGGGRRRQGVEHGRRHGHGHRPLAQPGPARNRPATPFPPPPPGPLRPVHTGSGSPRWAGFYAASSSANAAWASRLRRCGDWPTPDCDTMLSVHAIAGGEDHHRRHGQQTASRASRAAESPTAAVRPP